MKTIMIKTKGWTDIVDITDEVQEHIKKSDKDKGVVNLFVLGSTAALTTIEADENLYEDLKEILEKIAPYKKDWKHHRTWGDDNGASHVRASMFGPSLSVPFTNGRLYLGTWQKIVLIDFDTSSRTRKIVITIE